MITVPEGSEQLLVPPPALDRSAAEVLAAEAFRVSGTASELGGERDQNFRVDAVDGMAYVLKVSNPADDEAVLDLQIQALRHLARQDPALPVMRLVPTADGAPWTATEHGGARYLARLFTLVPGRTAHPTALDGEALRAYGDVVARTGRALRGFFHPAARYDVLWDLRHTPRLRPLLRAVTDPERRALAGRVLARFDERVAPVFDGLRAQPIHNDLTLDNVLLEDGRVSGILDFGDLTHTALVCDLAIALAAVAWQRPDPLEAAEATISGYARRTPLEDIEAELLLELVCARLVAWGTIAAWRVQRHPDNAAYITAGEDDAWALLERLETLGADRVRQRLRRAARAPALPYGAIPSGRLLTRRRAVLGRSPLSYREPVHLVAGRGVWVYDAAGERYLDAYNNVPVVGHAHPRVVEAVAGQARTLATNTRYLHEAAVTLAERLVGTMPGGLDTVLFVNSGSEANDLAWRLARAATGRRGAIVSAHAYHGVTTAATALSPEVWPAGYRPDHVATVTPPGAASAAGAVDEDAAVQATADAIASLEQRALGLAALVIDPALTSDGILLPDAGYLRRVAARVRGAGGLLVVDEVQAGHGRCGAHLWSFVDRGIEPDVVTLGKPMGNGYPVAAVVTRAGIAEALLGTTEVFSTFGGNPVACAAALAVLDVIADEGLLEHTTRVGAQLRAGLEALGDTHDRVAAVRCRGLLCAVDLRGAGGASGRDVADAVVNRMRDRGVLIGATGPRGDVLKIRPPLPFGPAHVGRLLSALDEALAGG